jgi:hypothetical protein
MRVHAVLVVMSCLALGLLAGCREAGELDIPAFPEGAKSTASADVTLGPFALWLTRRLMSDGDPEAEQVKRIFQGIKWVRVRSYKLSPGSPLPQAEIAALRRQLSGPGWSRLAETRDKHQGEDVDVYVAQDEHAFRGLAVLCASPEEVTVVNVVGTIDPRDIKRLGEMAQAHAHNAGETVPVSER